GRQALVLLGCRLEELSESHANYDDWVRGRLDVYRGVDGSAALSHLEPRWGASRGPIRRLPFDSTRLVGEHRHGRCTAPANGNCHWYERSRASRRVRRTSSYAHTPPT